MLNFKVCQTPSVERKIIHMHDAEAVATGCGEATDLSKPDTNKFLCKQFTRVFT